MRRDILDPLAESLNEADEHVSTVCIVDERQADFAGQSPSCRVVWEYWDSEAEARQRQWSRQLDTLARSLDRTGVFQTMAGRAQAELRPAVMELLRSLFRHPLGRLLPYAAVARRVLDEHSPDLVLTPDVADPLCRIYLLIGRKRRIPSVELQFGCCGDNSVEWAFSLADRVAVWGDNAGATLRELGVPSERIVVTGSPRHDQMVRQDADEAERIRRRLHMPEGRTLVLFASSICNSEYGQDPSALALAKTQRVILDLAAHAPDWALVYKPHPLEDTRGIRRELGSLPNVIWAEPREDICSLIRTCDVFVSLGSSSTMDALIAQKPTICAIFPGWVWDGLFTESGAVVAVHSPEELGMALRKAVSAPQAFLESVESARQHLLQEWAFQPGGACRRINDLALNLTPPGKPRYSESAAR
jgi:glycosyltransferase involved in cell wall biosynthesis